MSKRYRRWGWWALRPVVLLTVVVLLLAEVVSVLLERMFVPLRPDELLPALLGVVALASSRLCMPRRRTRHYRAGRGVA